MPVMRFRPMNGRVVIRRFDADAVSPGGIIIPEMARKRSEMGQVIEVCESWTTGSHIFRSKLKVGDIVIVSKYVGEEFTIDGQMKVLLIKEEDILSVIEGWEKSLDYDGPSSRPSMLFPVDTEQY